MRDPCFPVGCCCPASIPLFMEDYNIHTSHFYIPQWLSLTVVPIIYRSIFEHTQHLFYSSRSWYDWWLLTVFHGARYRWTTQSCEYLFSRRASFICHATSVRFVGEALLLPEYQQQTAAVWTQHRCCDRHRRRAGRSLYFFSPAGSWLVSAASNPTDQPPSPWTAIYLHPSRCSTVVVQYWKKTIPERRRRQRWQKEGNTVV